MRVVLLRAAVVATAVLGLGGLAVAVPTPAAAAATTTTTDPPWTAPVLPPRCTDAQVAGGDVADCVMDDNGFPTNRGWATPPFPTPVAPTEPATPGGAPPAAPAFPPPGWSWLGWTYNGSPALASWEQAIVANATAVGPVKAGQLRTAAAAEALFEGFVREIVAGGFVPRQYGGYSFRCTSTTRMDCNGLSPESLSYHAFGLAIDLDPSWSPQKTYVSSVAPDGSYVSACAQPVTTDFPAWVIRTAQRWGLFWGGYGWSRRCPDPSTPQASVFRDAMHFEYRGTPDQAAVIAAHNAAFPASWLMAPAPTASPTTTTPQPAAGSPAPTAPATATWTNLAKGSRGPAVTALQKALRAAKVKVSVTGYYGTATVAAVRAFQARAKLPVTGVVDLGTATSLRMPLTYARR